MKKKFSPDAFIYTATAHHWGQHILRIPLVTERIPAMRNEKTLIRGVSESFLTYLIAT